MEENERTEFSETSRSLAAGAMLGEDVINNVVCCQHPGCFESGMHLEFPSDGSTVYYCRTHAGDEGFCTGCGTFIDGLECSLFGTLCDQCTEEFDSDQYDDEETPDL